MLLVQPGSDEDGAFESVVAGLDERGFRIERADTLSLALERLSLGGVDVVFLDLDLPDSRGLETFERARAFAPDVPIVVMTKRDDLETGVRTVQAGAQDYLVRGRVDQDLLLRAARYAIERHRLLSALRSLALIDDLTGLYNRRGFMELGEQHLKLARRSGRPLTLLLIDLDGFKEVNDAHGHHVGDRCLVRVADALREAFRGSDLVARLEADQFAVLALEASGDEADTLVGRVRDQLEEIGAAGCGLFPASVSVGAARPEDGARRARLASLLTAAGLAMDEEKRRKAGEEA